MADDKNEKRGLASASKKTRERVARMGGEASGGGNRKQRSNNNESDSQEQ